MKAPAETKRYCFPLNTSDWLASPSVKLMSKAERGVYIMLLCTAWESNATLPASEDKVRRLADMSPEEWAVSGETLLEKFPLSDCGTYRYNPRLTGEFEKATGKSKKASDSANLRWQSERNANASETDANASEKTCERNAKDKISKGTTDVVPREPSAAAKVYPVLDAEEPLYDFTHSFFSTDKWAAVVADVRKVVNYAQVDFDHYRDEIRLADAVTPQQLPNRHWRKKLMNWLKNDLDANKLVKVAVSLQPKGRAANEPDYRLNNAAVARRRREQEEREAQMLQENLARVAANDANRITSGQFAGPLPS